MTSPTGAFRVASGYIEVVGKVNDRSVKQSADAAGNVITDSGKRAGQRAGDEIGRGLEDGTKKGAGKAGDRLVDGVKPGAKRAGDTIADEADRGGREGGRRGGEELGKGIHKGGEGIGAKLRSVLGEAGQGAGDAFGGSFMGKVGTLAAAGGLLELGKSVGGVFMDGFSKAIEQRNVGKLLVAKTGADIGDAKEFGKMAGDLYAKGFGDSVAQVGDALTQVIQSGVNQLDEGQPLEKLAGDALNVSKILGEDVKPVLRDVATLLRTGMAKDAKEAFDILVKGEQSGANAANDLLDTLQEYPVQFEKLGVKGPQAIGLISQAMKAGARSSDLAADALKEFSIRAVDGSKLTSDGFQALGLDAKKMADDIAAGGPRANAALDLTLDRLRGIKDPVEQSQAAVALFGTQAEDLGKSLLAMDPSNAVDALGQVEGAAKKAGDQIGATDFEKFKRGMEQNFVGYLDTKAIPAIEEWREVFKGATDSIDESFGKDTSKKIGAIFTQPLTPSMLKDTWKGTKDFFTKTVPEWFDGPRDALTGSWDGVKDFFTDTVPGWFSGVGDAAGELPGKIGDALSGLPDKLSEIATDALDDMAYAAGYGLGTVVDHFRDLPGNIWDAVTGLPDTLGSVWDGAWDFVMPKVRSGIDGTLDFFRNLPGNVWNALSNLGGTIGDIFSRAWNWARDVVKWQIGNMIWEIKNLPGKLWDLGGDIISGLVNGISRAGGRLWDLAKRLAGNFLGGFKDALGIFSPSKVMDEEVAQKGIGAGLFQGLDKVGAKLPANAKKMADGFVTPFKGALVDVKTPRIASTTGGTSDTAAAAGSLGPYVIQIGDRQFASFVIDAVTGAPKAVAAAVDEGRRQRGFVDTARARR